MPKKRSSLSGILVLVTLIVAALMACGCSSSGAGKGPTLVFIRSVNCPYCKQMTPVVKEVEKKYGRQLNFVDAVVEEPEGKELAREHGIFGFPTILLLDREGEKVQVLSGVIPGAVIEGAIDELLQEQP